MNVTPSELVPIQSTALQDKFNGDAARYCSRSISTLTRGWVEILHKEGPQIQPYSFNPSFPEPSTGRFLNPSQTFFQLPTAGERNGVHPGAISGIRGYLLKHPS